MIPVSKVKFVCGLSNGEDLVGGKGILSTVPNEDSPWWKLQKYIKDNDLKITSFYLALGDRHFVLPSVDPKFGGESPLGYNCYRVFRGDIMVGDSKYEHYVVAEALYPEYKVQIIVDEREGEKSWVNIVKKE